jgi:hypothetical protein
MSAIVTQLHRGEVAILRGEGNVEVQLSSARYQSGPPMSKVSFSVTCSGVAVPVRRHLRPLTSVNPMIVLTRALHARPTSTPVCALDSEVHPCGAIGTAYAQQSTRDFQ